MKKFGKSIWTRALAVVLCALSGVGLVVSVLTTVFFAEMGGTEEIYNTVYSEIADGYAMYAVNELEVGNTNALAEYLNDKGIACTITKESAGSGVQILEFSCGELRDGHVYERDLVVGGYRQYSTSSLFAVMFGYNYGAAHVSTVQSPVLGYAFDKETGLFYYETEKYYFPVDYVIVHQDGKWTDYSFTEVNGKECYYNGYYDICLDTTQYRSWQTVEIDGCAMHFVERDDIIGMIRAVTTVDIMSKGIGGAIVESNHSYVEYYPKEQADMYEVKLDWDYQKGHSCLFDEWNYMHNRIVQFESWLIVYTISNFVLFIIGFVLLGYSANNDRETMGMLHKSPVAIYSAVIFVAEFGLLALLLDGLPEVLIRYGADSVDVGIVFGVLIVSIMLWLAFVWLQSMITRFKCKSFWRTTEVYYAYKLCQKSWSFIAKPVKWCWEKITTPFRAVGDGCRKLLHVMGQNIPLFWGGVIAFVILSFLELFITINVYWGGDIFVLLYWILKVLELGVVLLFLYQLQELHAGSKRVASGDMSKPIDTSKMFWKFKEHGENINKVSDGIALAVEERMKSERFKTELITNVSHDIKTPLTSIINYVDLIKKEDVQDEKLQEYVDVLDRQSARLKKLIEDLMEASKASTGNLAVNLEECDVDVLLTQIIGEFEERLAKNQLEVVVDKPEHPVVMMADGRHIWRVIDNLLNNACKYSLAGTRVYVSLKQEKQEAVIVFKNISKTALNIPSDELMERFVRGDSSRNTEGSGLGLSIAQSLTELMKGSMKLEIDGDLFKVTLRFPTI